MKSKRKRSVPKRPMQKLNDGEEIFKHIKTVFEHFSPELLKLHRELMDMGLSGMAWRYFRELELIARKFDVYGDRSMR